MNVLVVVVGLFAASAAAQQPRSPLEELRVQAKQGDATAQHALAAAYAKGDGVPQDYVEALQWIRKAADQGNADALFALGFMYLKGRGVQQDYVEALKWYRKAAERGSTRATRALYTLGAWFGEGHGAGNSFLTAGQHVATRTRYAEIEVLPGVLLRQGAHSRIEVVSARPSHVQVRLLAGSIIVSLTDKAKRDAASVLCRGAVVRFGKRGVYRFDALDGEPPSLRVFRGQAHVVAFGSEYRVRSKQSLLLTETSGESNIKRFDPSKKDSLDQWNRARAKLVTRRAGPEALADQDGRFASEIHTIDLPREDRITQEAKAYEDIEFSNRMDHELNRDALQELGSR